MRTEALVAPEAPRDPQAVSTALEERLPMHWRVTTERGRSASLSSAGWVLKFGGRYQVRVAAQYPGGPLPKLHWISAPSFVNRQQEQTRIEDDGTEYACLGFHVDPDAGWFGYLKGSFQIVFDELEIEATYPDCDTPTRLELSCPVLARTTWSLSVILLLIFGSLVGGVATEAFGAFNQWLVYGELPQALLLQTDVRYWLAPLLGALLVPLFAFWGQWRRLVKRTSTLQEGYRLRYEFVAIEPAAAPE